MSQEIIRLKDMGSMMFGGEVIRYESGDTAHVDHGYAQYFVPENARNYPLIFWHGMGQSGKCWESTSDGRDGFWQIFTKKDWPVYMIDQPRRGRAGFTRGPKVELEKVAPIQSSEAAAFMAFRLGEWILPGEASLFEGSVFPVSPASLSQFFHQQTPDTAEETISEEYRTLMGQKMKDLLEQAGDSILVTHSNSGQYGWYTAFEAAEKVKAIVALEPGHQVFPDDFDVPYITSPVQEMIDTLLQPHRVSRERFMQLTKMPVYIYFGDYVSKEETDNFNKEVWRISLMRSRDMVNLINELGGNAKLFVLPEVGIKGNSHAVYAEKNNLEVAEHIEKQLLADGLGKTDKPYAGPVWKTMKEYDLPFRE